MHTVLPAICNECPFRRNAAQGWLGRNTPELFAMQAISDESIPCHQCVDYSLPTDEIKLQEQQAPRCRGALTLQRNCGKLPRDRHMADLVRSVPIDHETVFSLPIDFTAYHQAAKVKSWEIERRRFLYFENNDIRQAKVISGRLLDHLSEAGEIRIQLADRHVRVMPLWMTIYELIPSPLGIELELFQEGVFLTKD